MRHAVRARTVTVPAQRDALMSRIAPDSVLIGGVRQGRNNGLCAPRPGVADHATFDRGARAPSAPLTTECGDETASDGEHCGTGQRDQDAGTSMRQLCFAVVCLLPICLVIRLLVGCLIRLLVWCRLGAGSGVGSGPGEGSGSGSGVSPPSFACTTTVKVLEVVAPDCR